MAKIKAADIYSDDFIELIADAQYCSRFDVGNRYGKGTGLSVIHRFKYDDLEKVKSELEELTGYPMLSNTIGRFMNVSDYGIKQGIAKAWTKSGHDTPGSSRMPGKTLSRC